METFGQPAEWAVVIPSIRTINLAYLAAIPEEVKILVVDDSNGTIRPNRVNMEVYTYVDYKEFLGSEETLIPRKTDTCRSFGFYMAWRQGYRYIVTLDDDCMTHPGFLAAHGAVLGKICSLPAVSSTPWYNTLDNLVLEQDGSPLKRWYARGYPYCYRLEPPPPPTVSPVQGRVVCNMGMWLQVPDINGIDKIAGDVPQSVDLKEERLAIAPGTSFSLCIMNVAFLAEIVPAFYQLPMNAPVCNARLDRFGDIWSGYILKKLADIRGDLLTIGAPVVTHTKMGNTVREMQGEHFGHLLESHFYPLVDEAVEEVSPGSYQEMYHQFARSFARSVKKRKLPEGYQAFFTIMSEKMIRWSLLFAAGR
ncbi:MAG: hypothetical protein D6736_19740 [Nitrospinota bacterium]|nr:MAG: hypothetical protein D6736_19740 [Nitrospinota bacterium]